MKPKNLIIALSLEPEISHIRSNPLTKIALKSKSPNLNTTIISSSEETLLLLNPKLCLSCFIPDLRDESGESLFIRADSVVGVGEESSLPLELVNEILYMSFEFPDKIESVRLIPI